jgi:hypothetical protein
MNVRKESIASVQETKVQKEAQARLRIVSVNKLGKRNQWQA